MHYDNKPNNILRVDYYDFLKGAGYYIIIHKKKTEEKYSEMLKNDTKLLKMKK